MNVKRRKITIIMSAMENYKNTESVNGTFAAPNRSPATIQDIWAVACRKRMDMQNIISISQIINNIIVDKVFWSMEIVKSAKLYIEKDDSVTLRVKVIDMPYGQEIINQLRHITVFNDYGIIQSIHLSDGGKDYFTKQIGVEIAVIKENYHYVLERNVKAV
jgi:hypothetical protein